MYEVLERFEKLFPKTQIIKLEQNYRCTNVILDAANTVIKNNVQRKDKTLWSASTETTPIAVIPCEDDDAEARFVAEKAMSLLGAGLEPKDMAVLYRANAQAKPIEQQLREARIPYKVYGGQSFFERKEVKDFLSYLRLVLDTEDRLALWRVINTPQRGIGLKSLERIEELARAARQSPFRVLAGGESLGGGKLEQTARQFVGMIRGLADRPRRTPADYEALAHAILKESGLENDVRLRTEDAASRDRKVANLRSLPKWLQALAQDLLEDEEQVDERRLLDVLTLDNDRSEDKKTDKNHVSLMTIHAAKGLEFRAVFVIGVEEESLPHKNSILDPAALCEERRLFYVALTRAKEKLFLSHCQEKGGYMRSSKTPSRFLKELPDATFVKGREASQAQQKQTEDQRRTQTISRLGSLRASLGTAKRP
jgi:superfamily I DNA/RNA helicase